MTERTTIRVGSAGTPTSISYGYQSPDTQLIPYGEVIRGGSLAGVPIWVASVQWNQFGPGDPDYGRIRVAFENDIQLPGEDSITFISGGINVELEWSATESAYTAISIPVLDYWSGKLGQTVEFSLGVVYVSDSLARPDAKHNFLLNATGQTEGAIDDLEREWLESKIVGSVVSYVINDMYVQYFDEYLGVAATGDYNTDAYAFLVAEGITPAALPEMWEEYWLAPPPGELVMVFNVGTGVTYYGYIKAEFGSIVSGGTWFGEEITACAGDVATGTIVLAFGGIQFPGIDNVLFYIEESGLAGITLTWSAPDFAYTAIDVPMAAWLESQVGNNNTLYLADATP